MLINQRKIRYFQKFIISPPFEIILTISFLFSFFAISLIFIKKGKNINNYKLTDIIREEFEEETFIKIRTKKEFLNYIFFLVNRLYEFDPINNNGSFPYYIPYGSIRLKKYKNKKCSDFYNSLNESIKCFDDNCTLDFLNNISNNKCEYIFKNKSKKILGKFEGKYSKYDLTNEGEFIDFNIDDYYFNEKNNNSRNINKNIEINNKEKIENFILEKNSDIKFLAILFNVFFPVEKIYGNVICGIEMVNYRNEIENPYNFFSVSIFGSTDKKDIFFLILLILFLITSVFNLLKIILEVHSKFICSIHLTSFLSEILNITLTIILFIYLAQINKIPLIDIYSKNYPKDKILYTKNFIDFNPILNMKGYCQIFICIIFFTVPFKIISLFSWWTTVSKLFVQFLGLILRLIGLFIVNLIFFFVLNFTFIEINNNFYKDDLNYFQTFYLSMISHFFHDKISLIASNEYENENGNGIINRSFSFTRYFLLFNCIEKIFMIYLIVMIISSFINSLEKASQYEIPKEEDEILLKIKDIKDKLENEEENTDDNINNLKKQILWLNLGNKNGLFNKLSKKSKKKMLLFTDPNQIISFLKYLFAIKAEMQFKNLKNKIGIVIQEEGSLNSYNTIEKFEAKIFVLLDWLKYVGCKIPILIYTGDTLGKNLRMKFSYLYNFIKYTYDISIIEIFIKGIDQDDDEDDNLEIDLYNENKKKYYKNKDLIIEKVSSFMLYKINYLGIKKNSTRMSKQKINTNKKRKSTTKYNTNCNLNNMIRQIEKINNKLMLKRKENENLINQQKDKEREKETIINLISSKDIIDDSN